VALENLVIFVVCNVFMLFSVVFIPSVSVFATNKRIGVGPLQLTPVTAYRPNIILLDVPSTELVPGQHTLLTSKRYKVIT